MKCGFDLPHRQRAWSAAFSVRNQRFFGTPGALDFCLFHLPTWRSAYPVTLNRFYEELIASVKLADDLGWRCYRTTEPVARACPE